MLINENCKVNNKINDNSNNNINAFQTPLPNKKLHECIIKNTTAFISFFDLSLEEQKELIDKNESLLTETEVNSNNSLLHLAIIDDNNNQKKNCGNDNYAIIEYLIKKGIDINFTNKLQQTPLHIAVNLAKNKIINLLLENKANCNIQDIEGNTPMHIAALIDKFKIIKLLILFNANIYTKNNNNKYPYNIAVEKYHSKCIDVILKEDQKKFNIFSENNSNKEDTFIYNKKINDGFNSNGHNKDISMINLTPGYDINNNVLTNSMSNENNANITCINYNYKGNDDNDEQQNNNNINNNLIYNYKKEVFNENNNNNQSPTNQHKNVYIKKKVVKKHYIKNNENMAENNNNNNNQKIINNNIQNNQEINDNNNINKNIANDNFITPQPNNSILEDNKNYNQMQVNNNFNSKEKEINNHNEMEENELRFKELKDSSISQINQIITFNQNNFRRLKYGEIVLYETSESINSTVDDLGNLNQESTMAQSIMGEQEESKSQSFEDEEDILSFYKDKPEKFLKGKLENEIKSEKITLIQKAKNGFMKRFSFRRVDTIYNSDEIEDLIDNNNDDDCLQIIDYNTNVNKNYMKRLSRRIQSLKNENDNNTNNSNNDENKNEITTKKPYCELHRKTLKSDLSLFLSEIYMDKYTNLFFNEGYDDVKVIINQMKSGFGITDQDLRDIGIKKPGDRAKILIRFQEVSNGFDFDVPFEDVYYLNKKEEFKQVKFDFSVKALMNWLKDIKMDNFTENFYNNGYHSLELMYVQYVSVHPLNEKILENDIGIDKIGYRTRFMNKLKQCSENYIGNLRRKKLEFSKKNNNLNPDCVCLIY